MALLSTTIWNAYPVSWQHFHAEVLNEIEMGMKVLPLVREEALFT